MYGQGFNQGNPGEKITDNWINQNVPGGVNSNFIYLNILSK